MLLDKKDEKCGFRVYLSSQLVLQAESARYLDMQLNKRADIAYQNED